MYRKISIQRKAPIIDEPPLAKNDPRRAPRDSAGYPAVVRNPRAVITDPPLDDYDYQPAPDLTKAVPKGASTFEAEQQERNERAAAAVSRGSFLRNLADKARRKGK